MHLLLGIDPVLLSKRIDETSDVDEPRLLKTDSIWERLRAEARELGTPFVGVEHLLLALISWQGSNAHRVLLEHGVNRDALLNLVRAEYQEARQQAYTRGYCRVAAYLAAEAAATDRSVLTAKHQITAVLCVDDCLATRLLRQLGAYEEAFRISALKDRRSRRWPILLKDFVERVGLGSARSSGHVAFEDALHSLTNGIARDLGHGCVTTMHFLLYVIEEPSQVSSDLIRVGVTRSAILKQLENVSPSELEEGGLCSSGYLSRHLNSWHIGCDLSTREGKLRWWKP